jgi:hypothetical protein
VIAPSWESRMKITTRDISDAILAHISTFAVGLVMRKDGAGSQVLGSGVLAVVSRRRMRNLPKLV